MNWEYKLSDKDFIKKKSESLGLSSPLLKLLYNRGLRDDKNILDFLDCSPSKFRNPYDFESMKEAVRKIVEIKEKNEKLFIYGDYDVDGITATAFLTLVFRAIGINVEYYIPNRMDDGYGLNKKALDKIYSEEGKLIITVDTGINSLDEILYARELGIDLIITDHHKLVEEEDREKKWEQVKRSRKREEKERNGRNI